MCSEEVGPVSTAHEGGGVVLHQLSAASLSGHGRCDLGHAAADAIQQLLAERILQKPCACSGLDGRGNNALGQKFLVQGLDIELDGDMTLRKGQARGAVVQPLDLVEGKV